MARPHRNDVDYFPFICKEGKGMHYIENKYGNDGYATWVKILRQLAVTNYHYINLSQEADLMFLSSKCKISEDMLLSIIDDLCRLGEINEGLWRNNRIVFSEKFIENIQDAYKKRSNKCVDIDGLRVLLLGLGVNLNSNGVENGVNNPHTIVEYSKVKNTNTTVSGDRPPEKRKRESKKKVNPEAEPYWKPLVSLYFSFCIDKFGEKPSFDGSSPSDMHRIIEQLKSRALEKEIEWTEDIAKKWWKRFLTKAYENKWLSEHWVLSNLNRQKDVIILNESKETLTTSENAYQQEVNEKIKNYRLV